MALNMRQATAGGRTACKITAKVPVNTSRSQIAKPAAPKWKEAMLAGAVAVSLQVAPAMADSVPTTLTQPTQSTQPLVPITEDSIDSTIQSISNAIQFAGGVIKSGVSALDSGLKVVKQGYDVAAPIVEQGVKAASPYVEQAAKLTADAVGPALNKAVPAISDATKSIDLTSLSNPDLEAALNNAKGAVSAATPVVAQFYNTVNAIYSTNPVLLAEYALGGFAAVYLGPRALGLLGALFKGYGGEITAAQVLDSLASGNAVFIDIRTQVEKEVSGVPDVPSSVSRRCLEVELAVCEDKKLRGSLRDPKAVEATVTALQIASLKSVSKGTKIFLMDRYGNNSRDVAKELARKGFGKVYAIQGGFDGRNGWVQSKLQIKPAATFLSAPSLPVARTGTSRRALPAPK